jgi:hypothetical protein
MSIAPDEPLAEEALAAESAPAPPRPRGRLRRALLVLLGLFVLYLVWEAITWPDVAEDHGVHQAL